MYWEIVYNSDVNNLYTANYWKKHVLNCYNKEHTVYNKEVALEAMYNKYGLYLLKNYMYFIIYNANAGSHKEGQI